MDLVKVDEAVSLLLGEDLNDKYVDSVDVGEIPYQSNLASLKNFDIRNDAEKGEKELKRAISGIDEWIKALEIYRNAAKEVAKKGTAALRSA